MAKATRVIRKNLDIEPPNRSNIVTLRYHSPYPQEAARVLQALTGLYLERHVQVHRPAGGTEFFSHEVEQNRIALQQAEARLNEFTKAQGVVSADLENNTLLQKTADNTPAKITSATYRKRRYRKATSAASSAQRPMIAPRE
jgi:uncharacterized protein involved in exopolysaccharide biosynthesis